MSQFVEGPLKGFACSGALGQFLRVIFGTSTVSLAGVADSEDGTMENPTFAATETATVRLRTAGGTCKMVASAAITAGADVFAAASGKIAPTGSIFIGKALQAASGDGSVIEVLRKSRTTAVGPVVLAAASGAIAIASSVVVITKTGSLAAMTLAAPTAAQNGTQLIVTSTTAFAHTITATTLIDDGVTGGSKTTATFAAFAGASITLLAYEDKWLVLSKNVVTIS